MQLKKNSEVDSIEKAPESSQKAFPSNKKRKSAVGVLLKITFIYFPLGVILAALILPSFLNCANKAQQSEARHYVGSMNRAQQAEFGEKDTFAHSVDELQLGIKTQTTNFRYSVSATKTAAFSYGISYQNHLKLKSYVGAVFIVPATNVDPKATKNEMTTEAIMCVTKSPSTTQPANPILEKGVPTCTNGTEPVIK